MRIKRGQGAGQRLIWLEFYKSLVLRIVLKNISNVARIAIRMAQRVVSVRQQPGTYLLVILIDIE